MSYMFRDIELVLIYFVIGSCFSNMFKSADSYKVLPLFDVFMYRIKFFFYQYLYGPIAPPTNSDWYHQRYRIIFIEVAVYSAIELVLSIIFLMVSKCAGGSGGSSGSASSGNKV